MSDRLFALFLLLLALLYGSMALQLDVPFAYDPLGPKPVPLALAVILGALALITAARPDAGPHIRGSQFRLVSKLLAILLFYQATWLSLGFLLSTTISVYFLSRLFPCSWMQGLMTALLVAVICYGLFHLLLQIPLPLGTLFSHGSG